MGRYRVRMDCEVAGVWRRAGDDLELADAAARHLVPPHGNVLVAVEASAPDTAQPKASARKTGSSKPAAADE